MKPEPRPGAKAAKPAARSVAVLPSAAALARAIAAYVIPNNPNGWTFDPRLCQCVKFGPSSDRALYVVSVAHHELQLSQPPDEETLREWIGGRLELLRRPGYFVGGWTYPGKFFLDVSLLVPGLDAAQELARLNLQLAVFHPQTNQSIPVAPEDDNRCGPRDQPEQHQAHP
jgi:hypothetical protein